MFLVNSNADLYRATPWAVQHVLKITHDISVQTSIILIFHSIVESILRIIDIELGIYRVLIGSREKRANTVGKSSMDLENVRTSTTYIFQLPSHRCHRQGIIVLSDILPKLFFSWALANQKMTQFRRRIIQLWKPDLATETALAKFRIVIRRLERRSSFQCKAWQ